MARKSASTKRLTELLRTLPLFSACSSRELAAIAGAGKEVGHPADYIICREGDTGVGMHVILEGEVRVEVGGRTRRRMGPGAFFGEIALLDGGPRTASIVAETPVTTFVLPSWNFRSLLKSQPSLAVKVLEEVTSRLRAADSSLTH